jgi:superoxide reductase
MAKRTEIYRCGLCGNIVDVVHGSSGQLVCCGKPMERLEGKTADEGKEKHVPVIEESDSGVKVSVGSVPHPMEANHYIEWVELASGDKACRQFLKPGDKPEASFAAAAGNLSAREYCSVHGLWKA